jgi:hypothetical protein
MNLVVFGCSFTRDNYQSTWADYLAAQYDMKLQNCAERGAGAEYTISRLLTTSLQKNKDAVAIMWPSADRLDLWADDTVPHLQSDIDTAAWLDGVQPEFVDLHGARSQTVGFNLNGNWPRGYKEHYYKYLYSSYQSTHSLYRHIITAQLYLDSIGVDYIMMTSMPLVNPLIIWKQPFDIEDKIFNHINQKKFVDDSLGDGFIGWCLKNQMPFLDKYHPDTYAHKQYTEQFILPKAKHEFRNLT